MLSQQQHTVKASKSLLIVFHPTKIYLYFVPLSFCAPLQRKRKNTRPRVRPSNFHAIYTENFRSLFVLMVRLYETCTKRRNGTEWHERRRGALYCIIFLIHIFLPTYKVLFCIGGKKLKGNSTFQLERQKIERRKCHEMIRREERRENNSSNNIRKFILKAHSVFFSCFSSFRSNFYIYILLRSECRICCTKHSTEFRQENVRVIMKHRIICAYVGCISKINSTCYVDHNSSSNEFESFVFLCCFLLFFFLSVHSPSTHCCMLFSFSLLSYWNLYNEPSSRLWYPFCFSNGTKNILEW